jgi:hypothetical protein
MGNTSVLLGKARQQSCCTTRMLVSSVSTLLFCLTSDCDPPTYANHVAEITNVHHHICLMTEMGSCFLLGLALDPFALHLCFLRSWDYRHEPPCLPYRSFFFN